MKYIKLTKGYRAIVDDRFYGAIVEMGKWYVSPNSAGNIYARRNISLHGKQQPLWMHRVIYEFAFGSFDGLIDHHDGHGLNNQIHNLRIATYQQNLANSISRIGTSRYKGVCWHKRIQKWQANIRINNKLHHLGYFENEKDAALAYDHAAIEAFGEYANPNILGK